MEQKRQAVSGVLVAVIMIGISLTLAAIVLTFGQEFTENALSIEPINVDSVSIRNSGQTSYVYAAIKNSGNTELQDAEVVIHDGKGQLDAIAFSQTSITTGTTASLTSAITNKTDSHYLPYGKEVLVQIKAVSPSGEIVETKPTTVRVSKN